MEVFISGEKYGEQERMIEYWMVIKPAPNTPRNIVEKVKMWMRVIGSRYMKSKGLKYIPAIIDSAYAWGRRG
ncbi:MAG: hypothetical protein JTT15_06985 [Candidatus Brockarchaeota archaeon]|nr:hypothetical protein [Candidatus Brockarchaeota archaeon]